MKVPTLLKIGVASLGIGSLILIGGNWETLQNAVAQQTAPETKTEAVELDVPYVPTPETVVEQMLKVAGVNSKDVLYDLGSGDGRIVITASQKFGIRGVGVDIDPDRIREAKENAKKAGVSDRVTFLQQDLFKTNFQEATVVTLYLLPDINLRLRPKLLKELKPGTRIVSHDFSMGDWEPEKTLKVQSSGREHMIYFWTVPKNPPKNLL
jgi:predicted O-methyltransferase YrrM